MSRKFILFLIFTLTLNIPAILYGAEDGGYAGAFLQMSVQARPAAMGGAYIGYSDDAAGQLYNPAGIASVTQKTFTSAYRMMKLDRKLGFVSMLFPTRLESALGFSWVYAGYGSLAERNTSGQDLGTTIGSNEHDFAISFAKHFLPALNVGTKLNYYYKTLGDQNANSVGINLGIMIMADSLFPYGYMDKKPITDIRIGLVVDHIAAKYPWNGASNSLSATQNDKFPVTFGLGVSGRTINRQLLILADLEKNTKQSAKFRFGGEFDMKNNFKLRAGLNNGILTAGMGYKFMMKSFALQFDYAFLAERTDEGSDHLFGFSLIF
ncbi:conserved hypothetical protein [Candidatus Zixiibacteriota bacterium]|nr:conserved hypothetical protein [candidate division Zixibacteria bacterium]